MNFECHEVFIGVMLHCSYSCFNNTFETSAFLLRVPGYVQDEWISGMDQIESWLPQAVSKAIQDSTTLRVK
jgi:hypothetical protein